MCGIAGIFSPEGGITQEDSAAVSRMTAAQTHRGPDDSGTFDDAHISLGHRRLSIIDLSVAGRQPLANEDGTLQVVCNGEIYNYRDLTRELSAAGHRFRSASDCEVLVHGYEQWGLDGLLGRLRGMYAFLLYDARRKACFAVRDRLGIKPLYYSVAADGRCAFASEVKAVARACFAREQPCRTDRSAMAGFLLYGSVPHPLTWRSDVRSVEPGSYMEICATGMRTVRYWELTTQSAHADPGHILTKAVRDHLISDAPLGIFLSSGVDSIGLLALARRAGVKPRTLTVIFDEKDYSEDTAAIARSYGAEHSEIRVTAEDFMEHIPRFLGAMDQPTADGLNAFFVSKAAHESGLKAVLSGLGGDEVFRGYRHYHWLTRYERELTAFGKLPRFARKAITGVAADVGVRVGRESLGRLRGLAEATPTALYLAIRGFFASDVVGRLMGIAEDEVRGSVPGSDDPDHCGFCGASAFQATEIKRYLHDQLLRDADAFGMAWSLEIRVPYLDHEVVAQALAGPGGRHMRPGVNKPMLVDAIGDERVLAAARRPKTGFAFPLDKWMRRYSGELRERALKADLDRGEIRRLWAAFEAGHINAVRAWALVVLGSLS